MGECAILILRKLWFGVCHCCYYILIYGDYFILLCFTTVWYMSSLLLSIDVRWLYYFIMFYFKLTNGAMVKWWMVKWCNDEIKIRIGHFVSHKYWICSFVFFSNTTFSYSYHCDFFCSRQAPRFCDHHHHKWVLYIDTTNIMVLRFVWDWSVFTQYSYHCEFFSLGPALRLCNRHRHGLLRYIDSVCHCYYFLLINGKYVILLCFILCSWWNDLMVK